MTTPDDFYTDTQRRLQSENGHDKLAVAVVNAIVNLNNYAQWTHILLTELELDEIRELFSSHLD